MDEDQEEMSPIEALNNIIEFYTDDDAGHDYIKKSWQVLKDFVNNEQA